MKRKGPRDRKKVDITDEVLRRYEWENEIRLEKGFLVRLPTREEARALRGERIYDYIQE